VTTEVPARCRRPPTRSDRHRLVASVEENGGRTEEIRFHGDGRNDTCNLRRQTIAPRPWIQSYRCPSAHDDAADDDGGGDDG